MPHRQKLAVRAKMLMRCREALKLTSEGLSQVDVATRMGVSTDSVKRYVQRALLTESMFPSSLTPEKVGELRILEGEKLNRVWSLVSKALDVVDPHEAGKIARLAEAAARLTEQQARLWGLYQPTRLVEESLRVNLTKVDNRVVVHFDREQLKPQWPTPYGPRGRLTNGSTDALMANGSQE